MRFKSGIYEILSNDEASYIHGNTDEINTTHTKNVWLKNLSNGQVENITLQNSGVPIRPGAKIGLAFFNGEIIAFKRNNQIPVEDPVSQKAMHNTFKAALWAVFLGVCCSVPYIGYIAGIILGASSLIFGINLMGRYKKFKGNRFFGAFLLFMSIYIWLPYQSAHGDLSYLMGTLINVAILLIFGFLGFQLYKVGIEKAHYNRAVTELDSAWKQINAQEGNVRV